MSQNPKHDLGQVLGLILGRQKCLSNCTPGFSQGEREMHSYITIPEAQGSLCVRGLIAYSFKMGRSEHRQADCSAGCKYNVFSVVLQENRAGGCARPGKEAAAQEGL